jgi:hypothetical protein
MPPQVDELNTSPKRVPMPDWGVVVF